MIKRSLIAVLALAIAATAQTGVPPKKPADTPTRPEKSGQPKTPATSGKTAAEKPGPRTPTAKPTVAEAEKFMADTEAMLLDLSIKLGRAQWVQANFITEDTEALAAEANDRYIAAQTRLAEDVKRFDGLQMPPVLERKFKLLKLQLFSLSDPRVREEYTKVATSLEADYGRGKYCAKDGKFAGKCLPIGEIEKVLAASRDPEEMKEVWAGWHAVGAPMRQRYERFIALQNQGARELGFKDMGAMWRSRYDMAPDQFSAEVERLWKQVEPLYESLHAYTRTRLAKQYGPAAADSNGLIRADLLGNPWAQEWGNIYPLVAPAASGEQGVEITPLLKQKNVDEIGMVRYGENFFKSLGFAALPETFWQRSLFLKPRDRDVVCHASAWSMDYKDDLRLKMCIQMRDEDFVTVHHELGHNFYQRAYNQQPYLFQDGANDGFHEAVGDAVALSITPEYLKQVQLIDNVPQTDDTALLLRQAMDKIAFLPFGLVIDQWRWKVFSGEIAPADYNKAWWQLRAQYQGVVPPVARTEQDFDPGAKYHVPGNTPYTRYFLARVLQFQFYRSMCREAGYNGPLHRCSFFGNKAAGEKLKATLQLGSSRPWPEALKLLTGEDRMDAGAMMEYFAPLKQWLDQQNGAAGTKVGWKVPQNAASGMQ
ncbi:MAG TPA: M2 family metallopeptidase [Clostridia bacterium]|nr:M2 family metallopeptidase [Clostridia bacterium]